jgi:hypothetical protein
MPHVGFEPTIPAFEWAKIVYALDRAHCDRHIGLLYSRIIRLVSHRIAVYSRNLEKQNSLCERREFFFNAREGGTYILPLPRVHVRIFT